MAQIETTSEKSINYSEILRRFVHPTVKETDDLATIKKKYAFGIHVWNAATIKDYNAKLFKEARDQVVKKSADGKISEAFFIERRIQVTNATVS